VKDAPELDHTNIVLTREILRNLYRDTKAGETLYIDIDGLELDVARRLAEEYGFIYEFSLINEHQRLLYFKKVKCVDRWEYSIKEEIPKEWNCIDVGCGPNPWPRANIIVDCYDKFAGDRLPDQTFVKATVCETMPFKDKEFDFATAFHIFEHLNDPEAAAGELSRIAKGGVVECPMPWKDGLFLFGEQDHKWFVLPPKKDEILYFYPIDHDLYSSLFDQEAYGAIYRTYIGNRNNIGDQAILRNYYSRVEPKLNIIHRWEKELKVRVLK